MDQQEQAQAISRVFLRPITSPMPLGFLALAAGSFAMAGLELSWVPATESPAVGLVVLAFVAPLQTASFLFGFLTRDPAASTGMAVQAGGWLSIGAITATSRPGHASGALGLILLGAGVVMLVPAASAALSKILASAVMAMTSLRFFLTASYELTASTGWKTAAGIAGLILAALALYAGLAFEFEDIRKATVLPTLRRAKGRAALAGDLIDEVTGLQHEAGVRQRL